MYHMGLSFTSESDYSRGLHILRQIVFAGRERHRNLFGNRAPSSELIDLRFDVSGCEVSLLIRVSNLYFIGVKNAQATFYFKDLSPGRLIDNQVLLGFGGNYNDLGKFVSLPRLEQAAFVSAVEAASRWTKAKPPSNVVKDRSGQNQRSPDARHLLRLLLATSEAARFPNIGLTVANALRGQRDSPLTLAQIDQLVNDWENLSAEGSSEVAVPLTS